MVAEGQGQREISELRGFHEMIYVKLSHAMNGNTVCLAECVIVSICCGKHVQGCIQKTQIHMARVRLRFWSVLASVPFLWCGGN